MGTIIKTTMEKRKQRRCVCCKERHDVDKLKVAYHKPINRLRQHEDRDAYICKAKCEVGITVGFKERDIKCAEGEPVIAGHDLYEVSIIK